MSKNAPVKAHPQSVQKIPHPLPASHPAPGVRDVSARPAPAAVSSHPENGMLVAYKDMNEDVNLQLRRQKQQMVFAFSFFLLLGLLILAGQMISKPRMVASTQAGQFQVEGTPVQSEHYQYDKNCYKGENGEQVCVTRTSQSR